MTLVKFCGIRTMADADAVNEIHPDFAGFVFAPGRKRTIDADTAVSLRNAIDPDIRTVGVFLDQPIREIVQIAGSGAIDMIQLHGSESEDYVKDIRNLTGLEVIRAFTVRTGNDAVSHPSTCADRLMFDSGAGSGERFDWSSLSGIRRPFFLAGGLDADNVYEAIIEVRPFAVDVSSGIETEGNKDKTKMRAFMEAVRRADGRLER